MFTKPLATLIFIVSTMLSSTIDANRTLTTEVFKKAYIGQGKPRAAIQYLLNRYQSGKYEHIAEFSRLLIRSGKLTPREKAETYQLLALAERRNNNPERERRAWMQFYNLTFSSDALLRVVKLHYLAGRFSEGLRIANRVQLERLSKAGRIKWYAVIGNLYHDSRQFNNALFIRKRLIALQPTATNTSQYSKTLFASGQNDKAYAAIKRALKQHPNNPAYLLHKAYILNASGKSEQANDIISTLSTHHLEAAKIKANRAQQHRKNGNQKLARQEFKHAINNLNDKNFKNHDSNSLNRHIIDLSQLSIQSELRNMENKFTFSISNSICRDDNGCDSFLANSSRQSAPDLGALHALYQLNKNLSVTAGLFYSHKTNGLAFDSNTGLASIGIHFNPIPKNNLQVSLERQFGIGDLAQDNSKISLSFQHQKGSDIKPSATREKSWPYLHLAAEISKLIERQKDQFAFLEGRYGRTIKVSTDGALSPYVFALGNYHHNDQVADKQSTEAGIGITLKLDHIADNYKGNRGHTELFFRAGRDLYVSENDEEFRSRLGITFSYQ